MRFNKLFLAVGLLTIAFYVGCVDIPTDPVSNTKPDFKSMVRFVNAVPGQAAANLTVDGSTFITGLAVGADLPYMEVPSGSRTVGFGAASGTVALASEHQSTVVIYQETAGGPLSFINVDEGLSAKNYSVADSAVMKFVNLAQGSAANLTFRLDSVTAGNTASGVGFKNSSARTGVKPGSHSIFGISDGSFLATINGTQEVPAVTTNTKGSATVTLTVDGALNYRVEIKSDNNRGLFSAAHFHNAAAGVNGSIAFPITIDSQFVSFPDVQLKAANEVPATASKSTATATVSFDKKNGVTYSVSVKAFNSEGFFTGAHFHNAAAGVNGGVVNPITVTKQKMTFPVDSLSGASENPAIVTSAKGAATCTLYNDSLVYKVTVHGDTLDPTFTAGHFHNAAAGVNGAVVRNIILTSFSAKDTTFTGTWKTTDAQPLTPALLAEVIAGRIYVNFHSTGRPSGIIRAQLVLDSVTTNVFSGTWSDATLTDVLKDQLVFGNMYINFHTAANAGGAIRGQIVPDALPTNVYTGKWKTTDTTPLTPALMEEFNKGNMYINFHTLASPSGEVRGQVTVDPSGGQYGYTTSAATTFSAGSVYTLIAAGKGATFQLIKLTDRQGSIRKAVAPAPAKKSTQKVATGE